MSELDQLSLISKWYRGFTPKRLGSRFFVEFVAQNGELANMIAKARLSFRADVPTACTDGIEIFLPATYFMSEFFDLINVPPKQQVLAALACINGSQVHEALHVWLSPCKIDEYMKASHPAAWDTYKTLLAQAFNVVEDLFIEETLRQSVVHSKLEPFMTLKNAVLFGERNLSILEEDLADPTLLEPKDVVRCLSYLKDRAITAQVSELFDQAELLQAVMIVEQGLELYRMASYSDRAAVAIELCEYLVKLQEQGKLAETPEEDEGAGEVGSIVIMIDGDGAGKAEAMAAGEMPESVLQAIAQSLNEALEEAAEHQRIIHSREGGEIDTNKVAKTRLVDAMDIKTKTSPRPITDEREWSVLGRALRYARTIAHTPGRPREEGSTLLSSRLAHILIDGKVLAYRDAQKTKRGVPETIMLIDGSGSMRGHQVAEKRTTLLEYVASCAHGGFQSMMQAHLPCAVYSHTTYGEYGECAGPLVFAVAAFEMPLNDSRPVITANARQRFNMLVRAESNSNYDGLAIEFVGKRFTKRPGSKLLIVMSDGQPYGPSYSAGEAIKHTTQVVNNLRKHGVQVIAISLVRDVVANNDEIYGKDYNVHAYDGQLEHAIREIVSKLAFA